MSLKISNKATAKQVAILHRLDYYGRGKYAAEMLSVVEAAEIIDGLFSEQRLLDKETIHYL